MKKVLALVLAFAMMFSTITVAFAEPEVSAEAKALATVGMLEGDGNGVTAEYTAKEMTRFTAAISLLKLKGLYNDALAFKGDANFADVDAVKWEEGKNILAYLKANPGLGFGGNEKGEFNPNGNINEQSYYKVLLETLGYKQTTAEVAGDFAWAEVLEFAEKVGLKPAKAEKFTVDELAKATVAALKAKMKDGKVLINVLVEAGKVDKAKAVAAELMAEKPEVTAALKSAKAIGNTVVEVTFDAEINEGATDVALYSIEGLEVKDAVIAGAKVVRLETSAQTAGKAYTLVVGDVKFNFGGKAKVAGAPELKKVTGTDTETVELEFDKALDFVTATDVANYAIAGATIEKAELDVDTVTLTTNGLAANKTHTIKVTNVKSVDGVALKSASKSFYAKSDKTAPKVDTAKALTFKRVLVKFNEELDKETAENVENYTIANLTVEKAELVIDDSADEVEKWVELTTSAQKSGTTYSLKVKGVKDASVLANEMTKEQTIKFTGKSEDKTGPTLNITKTEVLNRNKIYVQFEDASRLDFATVQDPTNYEFDKDVTVEKVEMTPDYTNDTKTALLTVSDLAEKTYYKLTVTGVADEYGNEIKKTTKTVNYKNTDLEAAKISKVVTRSATEVRVYFSKYIDPVTAKDVANYTINGDIGTPISAKANDGLTYVTLKTNELVEGKEYKVTIKGLQDLAGNVLNTNSKFYGLTTKNDIDGPEIVDITVVNKNVLRITFDEEIEIVKVPNMTVTVEKEDKSTLTPLKLSAVYDDNTVLEFTNDKGFEEIEYRVKSFANVKDLAGNKAVLDVNSFDESDVNFWGNTLPKEDVDFSWEQVNVEKYKLTFSEKVAPKPGYTSTYEDDDMDDLDMDTVWYFRNKVAVDKTAWSGDINTRFAQGHGATIINTDDNNDGKTTMTASIVDEEAPYIENVEAVYRDEVKVTFNEELKKSGQYKITYYDLNGKEKTVALLSTKINGDDASIVNIKLSTRLESRFDYTLKVTSVATDLAGNPSEKDEEYSFMGTDLARPDNYITGVTFKNGKIATVALQSAISGITAADVKVVDEYKNVLAIANVAVNANNNKVTITLANTIFREDVDYTVTVKGLSRTFKGIVTDDVTIEEVKDSNGKVTGVHITYSDMKDQDKVYVNSVFATQVNEKDDKNKDLDPIVVKHFSSNQTVVKTILVERDDVALYFYVEEGATPESNKGELDALETALTSAASYKLKSNLVVSTLVIDKAFTLDLGGYTIDGDIEVKGNGLVTIKNGKIKGNVTLNDVNLDFTNDATIDNVTILNVKPNTFNNNGTVGAIVINTENAVGIVNKGTISSPIVVEKAKNAPITVASADKVEVKNESGETIKVNGTNVANGETGNVAVDYDIAFDAVYDAVYAEFYATDDIAAIEAAVQAGFATAKAKEVDIAWASDNETVIAINNAEETVKITQPANADAEVTLTGTVSITKDGTETIINKIILKVTVPKKEQ